MSTLSCLTRSSKKSSRCAEKATTSAWSATASVALMSSDIRRLPGFIALSRRVMTTIRANIALSIGVNILAVILSTVGTLTPVTGALVHNASSILVVLNSSVLLTVRDKWVR